MIIETTLTQHNEILNEIKETCRWSTRFLFGVLLSTLGGFGATIFALVNSVKGH